MLYIIDFVNSDNWIGKIRSKSTRLQPVFIKKKKCVVIKNHISSYDILRRSINCVYDWLCSFVLRKGFVIKCALLVNLVIGNSNQVFSDGISNSRKVHKYSQQND